MLRRRLLSLFTVLIAVGCGAAGGSAAAPTGGPAPENGGSSDPQAVECQLSPCHGLDVSCEPGSSPVCTQIYKLGDFCRKFASCKAKGGACELIKDPNFSACKSCVEACTGEQAFDCEQKCRDKFP